MASPLPTLLHRTYARIRSGTVAKRAAAGLLLWALSAVFLTSCKAITESTRFGKDYITRHWARAKEPSRPPRAIVKVPLPTIPGAKYVNNDQLCQVCHKAYVEAFEGNVHRNQQCEACHGPASKHLGTRGVGEGTILSFRNLKKAEKSEVCAQCHEHTTCDPGSEWRSSKHAHQGVACTDCHVRNHYNVPTDLPITDPDLAVTETANWAKLVSQRLSDELEDVDGSATAVEGVGDDALKPKPARPSLRGTSNNLGAIAPYVCYRCHDEKYDLERVAHPHQVNGPHMFNCETCHNPHGNVLEHSKQELCLQCHADAPTSAWHSSLHHSVGVLCTDCHDPHANANVPQVVAVSHTSISRPPRLPMSVDEPNACYKCHPEQFSQSHLPSHHPILEGKMSCSDCHDPHGETEKNLKAETVNMLCYKCHADKQGPFVHQHAPVEEDCSICHNPHGTVTNNLLHQPATFLCLRCHTGHRSPPADHFGIGTSDIDNLPYQRPILFTDCTQCHTQVHGSDLPSQLREGALFR